MHNWQDATCIRPKTCKDCRATEGEVIAHNWQDATCTKPETCEGYGATAGEVLGHTWKNGKCTECGAPKPSEGLAFTLGNRNYYIVSGIGSCKDTHIIIPDVYKGFPVTAIGESAFNSCESLTEITIPDSVKSIGLYAFASCKNLGSITLGSGVNAIGEDMFADCANLTGIWVSERNPAYSSDEQGLLFNKDKTVLFKAPGKLMGTYTIPESVTVISARAFLRCEALTGITIPGSVQSIGMLAFSNCDSLTNITIPEGVTTIDDSAFNACSNLKNITIPASVTDFGDRSPFYGCPKLTGIWVSENNPAYSSDEKGVLFNKNKTELIKLPCGFQGAYTVPNTVNSIGTAQSCEGLTSIIIPESVTGIDETTFAYCYSLTSVALPDSLTRIDEFAFYSCFKLESITIPKGLKILSSSVFAHCYSLKSVTIPDSVTNIHDRVFESCTGLESVTIPHSVTEIYYYAFDNCRKLTSITYTGTTAQWQNVKLWDDWNLDVPATEVICSDGTVSLSK
ncbi:MAG: leucine-rich repeat domain-containing protein [Ruminococcaceae bacterium]|nr:leucine-rich repeat domain-containing protein [Oscillospiraceae bacterium]